MLRGLARCRRAAITIVAVGLLLAAACGRDGRDSGAPQPIEVVKPTLETPFDRMFAWRPIDGATSYRVVVFNPEGQRSFEVRDVKGTSVALAPSVVLAPGRYSWQVLAFRDATELSQSAVTPFDLEAPAAR